MKDLVAEAVARTLGVSSKFISGWELNARQDGRPGMPGAVRTHLLLRMEPDQEALRKLQLGQRRGSWALERVDVQLGEWAPAQLVVTLLYGKETQHIFKALAQLTVYRRNQKGRRK
jgi:hypothetical protein